MDIVSLILSPEVIAVVAFLGCTVLAVRAVLSYLRGARELEETLARLDKTLSKRRAELPAKQKRVAEYGLGLPPLKQKHQQVLNYYDRLRAAEMEAERVAIQQEGEAEADRRRGRRRPPGK